MPTAIASGLADMYEPLHLWIQKNHAATLAEDRAAMTKIAREFTGYVNELLQVRRAARRTIKAGIVAPFIFGAKE
jgi:hypothetical protein